MQSKKLWWADDIKIEPTFMLMHLFPSFFFPFNLLPPLLILLGSPLFCLFHVLLLLLGVSVLLLAWTVLVFEFSGPGWAFGGTSTFPGIQSYPLDQVISPARKERVREIESYILFYFESLLTSIHSVAQKIFSSSCIALCVQWYWTDHTAGHWIEKEEDGDQW